MPRVTVLQHLAHEGAGLLGERMAARDVDAATVRLWASEPVPAVADVDALVVLGGDMDTDQVEAFPHLADEVALLADAVAAGRPVLGLCLGAQLLALATGGQVRHVDSEVGPEIGYVPVWRTAAGRSDALTAGFPDGTVTFNAHRDVVAPGANATVLAHSAQTPVHAFRVGSVAWGLQFHPEVTAAGVRDYVAAPGVADYLRAAGWTPERLVAEADAHDAAHRAAGAALLDRWLDLAEAVRSVAHPGSTP